MSICQIVRNRGLGVLFAAALALLTISGGTLRPGSALAVPANDNLADAIVVTTPAVSGIVASGSNVGASTDILFEKVNFGPNECYGGSAGWSWNSSVWYSWTSPGTPGSVRLDTWGSDFNTSLVVYTGSSLPLLTPVAGGCSEGFLFYTDKPAIVELNYAANTTYKIQVAGVGGAQGNLALSMVTGAELIVLTNPDNNTACCGLPNAALSLREAMLLANGAGLGRALDPLEAFMIVGSPGASTSDVVRFSDIGFPPGDLGSLPPSQWITLTSSMPDLSATGDVVSGIGAGAVVVDPATYGCFQVTGNSNHIEGMVLGDCYYGVGITGASNVVGGDQIPAQGNQILYSETGIVTQGATDTNIVGNTISGGAKGVVDGYFGVVSYGTTIGTPTAGNVISGNYEVGIELFSPGAVVQGNKIGTDATGLTANGNGEGIAVLAGLATIGGSAPGDSNIISGNSGDAILLIGGSNVIQRNLIGVGADFGALPNGWGILIAGVVCGGLVCPEYTGYGPSTNNVIGGSDPAVGNTVAGNTNDGVRIELPGAVNNTIRMNSIYSNGGLGIDLVDGGNGGRAAPVIQGYLGGTLWGYAPGCANCTVDIFLSPDDEGRAYRFTTTTTGATTFNVSGVPHPYWSFTALVTDPSGNTSEFSAPNFGDYNQDGDGLPDATDPCPFSEEDYDGFEDGDGCPDTDNDVDGILDASDAGQQVWDPTETLPAPAIDCRNIAEDYDGFKDSDGCPEPDNDNDRYSDGDDNCDGTDAVTGPDGMLGAPQDLNHNGIRDGLEASFSTDDLMLTFEDFDTVLDTDGCHDSPGDDFDGDGFTDEDEVFVHLTLPYSPDTDADTVIDGSDNCPNWPNAAQNVPTWTIPATDSDCDGFTVAREQWTGTNPTKHCNLTAATNDEAADSWPTDFNDSRLTSLADVVLMGPVYNQATGTDPAKKRFDLNASGVVSLADVVLMGPFYNKSCS